MVTAPELKVKTMNEHLLHINYEQTYLYSRYIVSLQSIFDLFDTIMTSYIGSNFEVSNFDFLSLTVVKLRIWAHVTHLTLL